MASLERIPPSPAIPHALFTVVHTLTPPNPGLFFTSARHAFLGDFLLSMAVRDFGRPLRR